MSDVPHQPRTNGVTPQGDQFEAIKQGAKVMFEQRTRDLKHTADLQSKVDALEADEKALKLRHRSLQDLAAQLESEVSVCVRQNEDRKSALTQLDTAVQSVHGLHATMQHALQQADTVVASITNIVSKAVRDHAPIPAFLAAASACFAALSPQDARAMLAEVRRLLQASNKLVQDVRSASAVERSPATAVTDATKQLVSIYMTFVEGWLSKNEASLSTAYGGADLIAQLKSMMHSLQLGITAPMAPLEAIGRVLAIATAADNEVLGDGSEDRCTSANHFVSDDWRCQWDAACSLLQETLSTTTTAHHPITAIHASDVSLRVAQVLQMKQTCATLEAELHLAESTQSTAQAELEGERAKYGDATAALDVLTQSEKDATDRLDVLVAEAHNLDVTAEQLAHELSEMQTVCAVDQAATEPIVAKASAAFHFFPSTTPTESSQGHMGSLDDSGDWGVVRKLMWDSVVLEGEANDLRKDIINREQQLSDATNQHDVAQHACVALCDQITNTIAGMSVDEQEVNGVPAAVTSIFKDDTQQQLPTEEEVKNVWAMIETEHIHITTTSLKSLAADVSDLQATKTFLQQENIRLQKLLQQYE